MSFTSQQIIFLQRILADKPARRDVGVSSSHFVEHFHLGVRVGRYVEYGPNDFETALNLLQNNNLPITQPNGKLRRANTFEFTGVSEKSFAQSPHDDSVAVKVASGVCCIESSALLTPPGSYVVVTAEQAMRISADRLMVVENLETFRHLERQRWIDYLGHNVLAIYRGDARLGLRDAATVIKNRPDPTWAFFDFDPAGLAMAASLDRLERVITPDMEWLLRETRRRERSDLYGNQITQYKEFLNSTNNKQIDLLWAAMKEIGFGYPQEWMEQAL